MSAEATAWTWRCSGAGGTDRLVLLAIADCADPAGVAFPKVGTLGRMTGLSRATIQRALKKLVDAGELRVDVKRGGTCACPADVRPNLYSMIAFAVTTPQIEAGGASERGVPRPQIEAPKKNYQLNYQEESKTCVGGSTSEPPMTPLELDPFWSNGHAKTLVRLRSANVPDDLLDPAYVRSVDALTDGTEVFWDDELIKYQLWWEDQPPSARHRVRRRAFDRWIGKALATDRARERREAERAHTTGRR